jgi:hypothetical protein
MDQGELMVRGQCMNCHTVDGYWSLRRLMNGRDRTAIDGTARYSGYFALPELHAAACRDQPGDQCARRLSERTG